MSNEKNNEINILSIDKINLDDYDFIDFGCSDISSLNFGANLFGGNGLGININQNLVKNVKKDIEKNKAVYHNVSVGSIEDLESEKYKNKFDFTLCIHHLQKIDSFKQVKNTLKSAINISKDFVLILQPFSDKNVELFKKGFKTNYSHWKGNPNLLTSFDFYKIITSFKDINDFVIFARKPILDSSNKFIHPINSPIDSSTYNDNIHPYKNSESIFEGLYQEIGVIISLNDNVNIDEVISKLSTKNRFGEKVIIYDSRIGDDIFQSKVLEFGQDINFNSKPIFFASSKLNLPNNFKVMTQNLNSILLSNYPFEIIINEFHSSISVILDTYFQENAKNKIIHDIFRVNNIDIDQTILLDENDLIINYWFTKNDISYQFQSLLNISIIDDFVKQCLSNSLISKDKLYNNSLKICLNELNDVNVNKVLINYLNVNCGLNIFLDNFIVENCHVYRTILIDDNKCEINYWFSINGYSYYYTTSVSLLELRSDIFGIISSFSSKYLDVINYLTSNLTYSLQNNLYDAQTILRIFKAFENPISIVIPIYNAYDDTKKAIESVFMNTTLNFNLILIDDCSTDNRIQLLLDYYEKYENVVIIRNKQNKGFTKNVNIGIKSCDTDVILLNSDAIVTPKWDQKLIFSAYLDDKIATVTPFSNATDVSIPIIDKDNKLPNFLNLIEMSRLVEKISCNGAIQSPTGNGFCLFIKRAAINDVGYFDEVAFDKGYGEETDFTMRLNNNGWKNIRNDSIFIYHNRSASFSSKKEELKKNHKKILNERYPTVFNDFKKFANSFKLNNSILAVNFALNNFNDDILKYNVLYVTDEINGQPLVDDIETLSNKINIFPLTLDYSSIKLWYYNLNEFVLIKKVDFIKNFPNIGQINTFYAHVYNFLKIDFTFLRFSLQLQLRILPKIAPLMFSSKIKIPILYGRNTGNLISQLDNQRSYINKKIDFKKEKGVVYTAIFGDYESLLNPKIVNPNLDYICFTDNPNLKSDVWNIKLVNDLDLDNTRKARTIKTLPHKFLGEYDFSFWFDAAFQIIGDLEEYVNNYSENGLILGVKHSWRNGIYEEVEACISRNKDDETVMRSQVERYKLEGYPKNNGLIESGALFRRHNNPIVINLMEQWYYEVMNFSKRDQLSFDYVCWKNNFVYDKAPIFYWKNHYFEHFYHIKGVFNNRLTKDQLRVILIANDDFKNTESSINHIININDDIPISIISSSDYSAFNSYNINYYQVNHPNEFIDVINTIVNKFNEKFIYLICSGDIIKYSNMINVVNCIQYEKHDKIGAFLFGDYSYIQSNIYSNFSSNHCNCGILLNRFLVESKGGFEYNSRFIDNFISKIKNEYKII